MRGVVPVSPQEKAGNAVGWGPSCQPGERAFGLHTPNRRVQAADLRWRQQPDWAAPGDVSDGVLGLPRGVFPCGTNRKHLARTQHSNKTLAWQARHARRGADVARQRGARLCHLRTTYWSGLSTPPCGSTNDPAPQQQAANPLARARWEGGSDREYSLRGPAHRPHGDN